MIKTVPEVYTISFKMLLNQYHITSSEWELKSYQRSLYLCHKLCFCMMRKVDTSDCYMLGFLGDQRWLSSTLKQAADLCSPVSARDKLGTKGVNPVSLSYDKCHEALRQLSCVKVGQCENRGAGHTFVRVLTVVRDTHTFVHCLSTRLCTQLPLYPVIYTLEHTHGVVSVLYFYLGPRTRARTVSGSGSRPGSRLRLELG